MDAKKQKDDVTQRLATSSKMHQLEDEMARWHRDAQVIKARMKKLERGAWSKRKMMPTGKTVVQSSLGSVSLIFSEFNIIF